MIFRFDPGPKRANLGFVEAVTSAFNFLTKEYGFSCVKSEPTFVRYEAGPVFVNVCHGRGSYELNVEVGQMVNRSKDLEEKFYLGDILDRAAVRTETGYPYFQTHTKEGVQEFVPKLAAYIRKYADDALRDDPEAFKQLRDIQAQKSDKFLKDIKLERIRQEADKAWRSKDYQHFVQLYEPIRSDLTGSEVKKLSYAKKRM